MAKRRGVTRFDLVDPTAVNPTGELTRWYEEYPRLSSAGFTVKNSGNKNELPPPYELEYRDGRIVGIEGYHGLSDLWVVIGYTETPPFPADYPAVALMFESTADFEQIWWHYPME